MGFIIGDSCTDLTPAMKEEWGVTLVPLTLRIGNEIFVDDESFDQADFLHKMQNSKEGAKSSCPSPQDYKDVYDRLEGDLYVVTLSSKLSGSFNSATVAKDMMDEERQQRIHIFDSESASIGQTMIAYQIHKRLLLRLSFEEIVSQVEEYIDRMHTFFILESLDNLTKNGRFNPVKNQVVRILSIVPIMTAIEGSITQYEIQRGSKKAMRRLIELVTEFSAKNNTRELGVAHCNCLQKAEEFIEELKKRHNYDNIFLVDTAGVATLYAEEKGLIVAF